MGETPATMVFAAKDVGTVRIAKENLPDDQIRLIAYNPATGYGAWAVADMSAEATQEEAIREQVKNLHHLLGFMAAGLCEPGMRLLRSKPEVVHLFRSHWPEGGVDFPKGPAV